MKDFPTDLAEVSSPLNVSLFNGREAEMLEQLSSAGFEIRLGLTRAYCEAIRMMCLQPSIKEYCPNDSGVRFHDDIMTEEWLKKGRCVFLLTKKSDDTGKEPELVGYGWSGPGETSHVPGGKVTVAPRIGEGGQGHGLGTPFCWLIVAATAVLYEARDFWLETWESNGAAVHIYGKLNFVEVDREASSRPTADGGSVDDIRLFMTLDNSLLPKVG